MKLKFSTPSTIYFSSAILSILFSVWGVLAQRSPNPDAVYYLQAAEMFVQERWHEALAVYHWPFYSLSIATIMTLTMTSSYVAAQILNAALDGATVAIFLALIQEIARDKADGRVLIWAATIILLHPRLMALRPIIVRDHGHYTFLLLTLYLMVRDHNSPKNLTKFAILPTVLAAALFRFEALILFVLVPAFYLLEYVTTARMKTAIIFGTLATCLLLVPLSVLWTSGTIIPKLLSGGSIGMSDFVDPFNSYRNRALSAAEGIAKLFGSGRNVGGVAFSGAILAISVDIFLRAVTLPIVALAALAFTPRRLLSNYTSNLVMWLVGWQLPILIVFLAISLVLDWRYAMSAALVLTIPAAFTVHEIEKRWRAGEKNYQLFFVAALLALIVPWLLTTAKMH